MKSNLMRRKGAILLQTLVMSILLCMIAVMLMKWVLARYIITSRMYRSAVTNVRTEGYVFYSFPPANWETDPVTGGNKVVDGVSVSLNTSGAVLPQTITGSANED